MRILFFLTLTVAAGLVGCFIMMQAAYRPWLPFFWGYRGSDIKIVELYNTSNQDRVLYRFNEQNRSKDFVAFIPAGRTIEADLELHDLPKEATQFSIAVKTSPDQNNWNVKLDSVRDSKKTHGQGPQNMLCPSGVDIEYVILRVFNDFEPADARTPACIKQRCCEWARINSTVNFCGDRTPVYKKRTYLIGIRITNHGLIFYSKGGILAENAHNIALMRPEGP